MNRKKARKRNLTLSIKDLELAEDELATVLGGSRIPNSTLVPLDDDEEFFRPVQLPAGSR